MSEYDYRINREFLKDSLRKRTDFSRTDQNMGRFRALLFAKTAFQHKELWI